MKKGNYLADSFYNLGNLATQYNKYDFSIKLYKESLKHNPNNASVYNNMATSSKRLGEWIKAESYYKKSIEVDPEYIVAYLRLAILKAYMGNEEKALEFYNKYLSEGGEEEFASRIIDSTSLGGPELKKIIMSNLDIESLALKYIDSVEMIFKDKYAIEFSYKGVVDMSGANKGEWIDCWGDYPGKKNLPSNICILVVGVEVDGDGYIITSKTSAYEEQFNNLSISLSNNMASMDYIIENKVEFIEDIDFYEILRKSLKSEVKIGGIINYKNKKTRIYRLLVSFIE